MNGQNYPSEAQIQLRSQPGVNGPDDLVICISDKTFDYLMSSAASEIRVSGFLDRDWDRVEAEYAEVYVHDTCRFVSKVTKLIPGSRTRRGITLPGPMEEGEQVTVLVNRTPVKAPDSGNSSL